MIEIDGELFEAPIKNFFDIYFDSLSSDERTYNAIKTAIATVRALNKDMPFKTYIFEPSKQRYIRGRG